MRLLVGCGLLPAKFQGVIVVHILEDMTQEQKETEVIAPEDVQLVKTFRNFLTRRNPRVYLPTLHNPETGTLL